MDHGELIGIISERPRNFAWLMGAGASRSAGLPTATDIIWDLKRRYYCREEDQEIDQQDIQIESVREKIQTYMTSRGFPEPWEPGEYASYFEKVFGDDRERQSAYLRAVLGEEKASLSVGNRALAALIASGNARVLFTTNFDTLVERAVAEVAGISLSPFHLEGSYAANDALNNEQYPIYCKLHGDFRYQSIKNLTSDLKSQNAELGKCLINACNRFGLVVTGYSGRDGSVMELLRAVLQTNNPFPNGLYWTGVARSSKLALVEELLAAARKRGVKAEYVAIETFDAFLSRLWRNTSSKPPELDRKVRKTQYTSVDISLPATRGVGPLVRINALPIVELPRECFALQLKQPMEWENLRNIERNRANDLMLTKGERVWAWGKREVIETAFKGSISKTEPVDLAARSRELKNHLHLKAFLEKALSRALARNKPLLSRFAHHRVFLITDRHAKEQAALRPLTDAMGKLYGDVPGLFTRVCEEHPEPEKVSWAEAVQLSIEEKNGRHWLVLDPQVWIWPKRARRDATAFLDAHTNARFNARADELLTAWCRVLLGTTDQNVEVVLTPFDDGDTTENPKFRLGSRTAFSRQIRA